MTTTCDPWQTTFFFNIRANFKTNSAYGDPNITVSVPLGKTLPSDEALKAATATATVDLTEALRSAIDDAIAGTNASEPLILGANDWKTVWGPQVFCVGPQTIIVPELPGDGYIAEFNATNAMYVVHSASLKRYIVAIAATNTPSLYDWIVEDLDTSRVVTWERALRVWSDGITAGAATAAITSATAVAENAPYISHATFTGTTILLNIVDTVITQKTLVDFLKGLTPPAGTTVTFTGHSLAGALSPALAMACFDPDASLLKGSAWSIGDAMVYPTAGATPGNGPFASRFNSAGWGGAHDKGKRLWQVWNHNLYNNLDIVPHAWDKTMLNTIDNIYSWYYPKNDVTIKGLIAAVRVIAEMGEKVAGAYTPISNQALNPTGVAQAKSELFHAYEVDKKYRPLTPQQASDTLPPKPKPIPNPIPWNEQAILQHTIAYGNLLEIPEALLSNNSKV
jgi:hypothetical protein